ncbi:hypothetical protein H2248_010369 [Termitomyces sp. 'cryptogamus']|nr:hypothetical protein H2248_010369 [Termitomyces sp. 'cryptogamus']
MPTLIKVQNVIFELLLEAEQRQWLVIVPAEREPSRLSYTTNIYKRIKELPNDFRILRGRGVPHDSAEDEPKASQDLRDLYWATTNSLLRGTVSWCSAQSSESQTPGYSNPSSMDVRYSTPSTINEIMEDGPM